MYRLAHQSLSLVLFAVLLLGCAPPATTEPPATTAPPTATSAPPSITPSPPPTATRTPSGTATAVSKPAIVAQVRADLNGFWHMHYQDADFTLDLLPDGKFDLDQISVMGTLYNIQNGIYKFSQGNVIFDGEGCNNFDASKQDYVYFRCKGTYKIYSTYREDTPVLLKFVRVDDPWIERANWFKDRTWGLATPLADVIGSWTATVKDLSAAPALQKFDLTLDLRPEGSYELTRKYLDGTEYRVEGNFRLTGGDLIMDEEGPCPDSGGASCPATYRVYCVYNNRKPVLLRFVRLNDKDPLRGSWLQDVILAPTAL